MLVDLMAVKMDKMEELKAVQMDKNLVVQMGVK